MGESTWTWSKTAASNASADSSINWAEGQSPGTVNNSARSMMAAEAKLRDDQGGALTLAGGTTAYTLTTNQGLGTLADGVRVHAVVNSTNTGASTLAVDGLTAKAIRRLDDAVGDIAIAAGEMPKNFHAVFQYDASANAAAGAWIWVNAPRRPAKGHINGLTLSNNATDATNDIDIAAGVATDSTGTVSMVLSSAITKRLDAAWAVGTNQGGLDTGAIANTTYFMYLIMRADTGVVDVIFSASASSPTMPTNYTHYRYIGAVIRSGGALVAFVQDGDVFRRKVAAIDIGATNPGTSAVTATLSVPVGRRVQAVLSWTLSSTTTNTSYFLLLTDLSITDTVASNSACVGMLRTIGTAATYISAGGEVQIMTNTSGQVRYRVSVSDANLAVSILTHGWIDTRGKES